MVARVQAIAANRATCVSHRAMHAGAMAAVKSIVAEAGLEGAVPEHRLTRVMRNQGYDAARVVARLRAIVADGRSSASESDAAGSSNAATLQAALVANGLGGVVPQRRLLKVFHNHSCDVAATVERVRAIAAGMAPRARAAVPDGVMDQVQAAGLGDAVPAGRLRAMLRKAGGDVPTLLSNLQDVLAKQRLRNAKRVEKTARRADKAAKVFATTLKREAVDAERVAVLTLKYADMLHHLDVLGFAAHRRTHLLEQLVLHNGDVGKVVAALRGAAPPAAPTAAPPTAHVVMKL